MLVLVWFPYGESDSPSTASLGFHTERGQVAVLHSSFLHDQEGIKLPTFQQIFASLPARSFSREKKMLPPCLLTTAPSSTSIF